jgi:hypothetical protein
MWPNDDTTNPLNDNIVLTLGEACRLLTPSAKKQAPIMRRRLGSRCDWMACTHSDSGSRNKHTVSWGRASSYYHRKMARTVDKASHDSLENYELTMTARRGSNETRNTAINEGKQNKMTPQCSIPPGS